MAHALVWEFLAPAPAAWDGAPCRARPIPEPRPRQAQAHVARVVYRAWPRKPMSEMTGPLADCVAASVLVVVG